MSADEPAGTARFPGSQRHRGRLVYGLGQTLALWLTVMLVAASVRHIAAAWAGVGVGLVAGLLLGRWHQRRRRADTAVGAFTGVVLWPLVIAAVVLAIGGVAEYQSDY